MTQPPAALFRLCRCQPCCRVLLGAPGQSHPCATKEVQTPGATPCHPVLRAILGSLKGCKHRVPPLCHHRAVNATCHPCATKEVIPAPIFPPTAQLCLQGHADSGCHPRATPVPCWISSSTHFPPYNPAVLPSALPSFPPPCSAPYHHSTKHTPPSPAQGRKTTIKQNKRAALFLPDI